MFTLEVLYFRRCFFTSCLLIANFLFHHTFLLNEFATPRLGWQFTGRLRNTKVMVSHSLKEQRPLIKNTTSKWQMLKSNTLGARTFSKCNLSVKRHRHRCHKWDKNTLRRCSITGIDFEKVFCLKNGVCFHKHNVFLLDWLSCSKSSLPSIGNT